MMPLAGYNIVSIGIFSWTHLEPEEGRYTFNWLDDIMDRVANAGMKAALATPSGAKPAWMSERYPEIRRVTIEGVREPHKVRHNHCPTSPVYREKIAAINERLAERYAKHPALGMWHVSNEYGGECHCPLCYGVFQAWIKRKYKSLDALNDAWWTSFWSHTFTDWGQVRPVDPSVDGMALDWKRFVTHQTADFMRHEIAAVRKFAPDIPVTTNMMGTYSGLDYSVLADHVDFIANDSYPVYIDQDDMWKTACDTSFMHDIERGLRHGQPFLQMECSPSVTNWAQYAKLKRPGVHRAEALQAVSHGAEGVMYFQWRKGRGGHEKNHGAVVDHVGHEKTRVFRDVAEVGSILGKLQAVRGTVVESRVALIYDMNARWALDLTAGPGRQTYRGFIPTCMAHYRAFWKRGINVDVIRLDEDLSRYRVVVAPMLYLVDEEAAARLRAFVEGGGTLVMTYLSAVVDDSNRCHTGGRPGAGLRGLFGIWVEDIDHLMEQDAQGVKACAGNRLGLKGSFKANTFCEIIHAERAEVVAAYTGQFYEGTPAVTARRVGKGVACYIGARTDDDFLDSFYGAVIAESGVGAQARRKIPEGVAVRTRTDGQHTWTFVINFRRTPQTVVLAGGRRRDVLTGKAVGDTIRLPGYGSAVLADNA
jgi:beta-galactosidase